MKINEFNISERKLLIFKYKNATNNNFNGKQVLNGIF